MKTLPIKQGQCRVTAKLSKHWVPLVQCFESRVEITTFAVVGDLGLYVRMSVSVKARDRRVAN